MNLVLFAIVRMRIKRSIVILLERACDLWDRVGLPYIGCWFAVKSSDLDEKWGTKVWRSVDEG